MRIGLIADTHMPVLGEVLWPEIVDAFRGVDLILHAGDVTAPVVLDRLEGIAPVLVARGNNDLFEDRRLRDVQFLDIDGRRLAMIHDIEPEDDPISHLRDFYLGGSHVDILISGHTHLERLDIREGVLQINPGSPTQPHLWSYRLGTVGVATVGGGEVEVSIVRIGETAGLRNPGVEYRFTAATGVLRLG